MKTFFKRTAAAATGSVLALSQLASIGVTTINAADSVTLDKAWVVSVPIEEKALKLSSIVEGDTVKEITESVQIGESKWNSDFETAILAIAGSGAAETTVDASGIKSALKTGLASAPMVSKAQAQAIVDGIADAAEVSVDDEITTITLECGEIGTAVGEVIEEMMHQTGAKMKDDLGNDVPLDWSDFKVSGKLTVTLEYTYDKNIAYTVTFTDELNKTFGVDGIIDYAERKISEAEDVVRANLAAYIEENYGVTVDKYSLEMTEFRDYAERNLNKVKAVLAKLGSDVSGYGASPQYAYDAYLTSVKEVAGKRVANQIDKRAPKTVEAVLTNARAAGVLDSVLSSLGTLAGDSAKIDISAADLADVLLSGYDYDITYTNIASANAVYSIEDDQNAELLAALQAIDEEVESVESHKEITLDVASQTNGTGNLYYNVVRVIDKIVKKEVTTTSSTTTTTTTTTTEEPTTSSTTSTTVSTTTEEPTTSSTTSTTVSTTTEEPTTSSTTSTTVSTTVSTTTESVPDTDAPTTSSTTSTTVSTTVSTTTESAPDTDAPTTSSTTTTSAPTYSLEFVANGGSLPRLYYWTEEEVEFNFSDLKVMMNIYKNGEQQAAVDVTEAFSPTANKPSQVNYTGAGSYVIDLRLTDEAAVKAAIQNAGFDPNNEGFAVSAVTTSVSGSPLMVNLVLRGDVNFDGIIDVLDSQQALMYYGYVVNSEMGIEDAMEHKGAPEDPALLPYFHYAADVFNGNGVIEVYDPQAILAYYNYNFLSELDMTWDEVTRHVVTPLDILHSDPLAKDETASTWYAEQMAQ